METLDSQTDLLDRLFIRIDVEGGELGVLRGATTTVDQRAAVVLVRTEERHRAGSPAAVIQWFADHDFTGWMLYGGNLVPADRYRPHEHQAAEAAAWLEQIEQGASPAETYMPYGNEFCFVRNADTDAFTNLVRSDERLPSLI